MLRQRLCLAVLRCLGEWIAAGFDFDVALQATGDLVYRKASGFHMNFSAELGAFLLTFHCLSLPFTAFHLTFH